MKKKVNNNIWLRALYWGLVLTAIYFAYLNIAPYEKAVSFLSGQVVNKSFLAVIAWIPIINGIAAALGRGITWILGAILWSVIQIIEVIPLILYNHEGFLRSYIRAADNAGRMSINSDDDPTLRMLKKTYNTLPTSVITNLEYLKIGTYVADFLICLTVYSPVKSAKFSDFVFIITTGQWGKIDYANLCSALITLFAMEIIISLIIWVGKLTYVVRQTLPASAGY